MTNKPYDYSHLDVPEILINLFHPRHEGWDTHTPGENEKEILIPVPGDQLVGAKFHLSDPEYPVILFFHGNGEIVTDYDDIAGIYRSLGLNFLVVDYRGYGKSTGEPGVVSMIQDAHVIYDYVTRWLTMHQYSGPVYIMGRSLGSVSAIELADHYGENISGLILESAFAHTLPLLNILGIYSVIHHLTEEQGFRHIDKIKSINIPLLVIHGENDSLIPVSDGETLFNTCPSEKKTFVPIPGADHNTVMMVDSHLYFHSVKEFAYSFV